MNKPSLQSIAERVAGLEARIKLQEDIMTRYLGIEGSWVAIDEGAVLLRCSDRHLRGLITEAEEKRKAGEKWRCKYGVHYRTIASSGSERDRWQVNWRKFDELFNIPPEQRWLAEKSNGSKSDN